LPGFISPKRIGAALEGELVLVDRLHAAVLEDAGVRVEDQAAVVLVDAG
jgi:hypothetical protein